MFGILLAFCRFYLTDHLMFAGSAVFTAQVITACRRGYQLFGDLLTPSCLFSPHLLSREHFDSLSQLLGPEIHVALVSW